MAYANPDAVTQIANGLSTTSLTYDNDGNLAQKTVDGTTTTYLYDYANRLIAIGSQGAPTPFGYDAFGVRVLQTGTSTTTLYPFKWYSVASSTGTGAKYATTTDYVFNGDSLVSTVDQQTASGNATGTAKTRYIHPDHLGSTNIVTDENDQVVQTLDYYPYGSTRISSATSTNELRKYIGQFSDDTTLSYLNARYYDSARGQFIGQDPVFWGDPKEQNLRDPQSLNTYSYADDNPITGKDPTGKQQSLAGADPRLAAIVALATLAFALLSQAFATVATNYHVSGSSATPTQQLVQPLPSQNPFSVGGSFGFPQAGNYLNLTPTTIPYNFSSNGLPPKGVYPPDVDPDSLKVGPASRPSVAKQGGQSTYDQEGGEWRYAPEDKYHNPHWDYNPHQPGILPDGKPGNEWRNVPIDGQPPIKSTSPGAPPSPPSSPTS
jgi:RHS repeat-associated protein